MSSAEPPATPSVESRLLALIRRELGSDAARLIDAASPTDAASPILRDPKLLVALLPDGRQVVAEFSQPPPEREVLARRLELLVSAFAHSLEARARSRGHQRLPPALSLRDELCALTARARALDAFVIDAHSPVIWGSASGFEQSATTLSNELFETVRLLDVSRAELHHLLDQEAERVSSEAPGSLPAPDSTGGPLRDAESTRPFSLRALDAVRGLPAILQLRRGHVLHHSYRGQDLGYAAHSFAGIYLLVLVFDAEFDELRAERALQDALARVERLVLALPPRDPSPSPMAKAMRSH